MCSGIRTLQVFSEFGHFSSTPNWKDKQSWSWTFPDYDPRHDQSTLSRCHNHTSVILASALYLRLPSLCKGVSGLLFIRSQFMSVSQWPAVNANVCGCVFTTQGCAILQFLNLIWSCLACYNFNYIAYSFFFKCHVNTMITFKSSPIHINLLWITD